MIVDPTCPASLGANLLKKSGGLLREAEKRHVGLVEPRFIWDANPLKARGIVEPGS